jgi:Polyketide cyclase / dehydrase and lipid transport
MAEYGSSVETSASPESVWKIWSDMSTWGDWNPNVSTMEWTGGFVQGSEGMMNTRAGQHHKMKLAEVQPGRFFALETRVVPGTMFRFNCRVEPSASGAGAKISQMVEVKGPLGPIMQGMMGPQVSKEFPTLLANLARKAEGTSGAAGAAGTVPGA